MPQRLSIDPFIENLGKDRVARYCAQTEIELVLLKSIGGRLTSDPPMDWLQTVHEALQAALAALQSLPVVRRATSFFRCLSELPVVRRSTRLLRVFGDSLRTPPVSLFRSPLLPLRFPRPFVELDSNMPGNGAYSPWSCANRLSGRAATTLLLAGLFAVDSRRGVRVISE
jgi:hypothetical protein